MINNFKIGDKKAQITIFIILAIIIVAGIGIYFAVKGGLFEQNLPAELEPVYSYYLSCIEAETFTGASILGQQGGYISQPEFSPGSQYMPFSSQLNFLGIGVPYWYYISGNGVIKEQMPSKEKMQSDLNDFLDERILECNFEQFEEHGMIFSGINPDSSLVEILELSDHPWFIGTQFHPELKSTVLNPHPLFVKFVAASLKCKKDKVKNGNLINT